MSNEISAKAIRYMENTFERLQFLGYDESIINKNEFLFLNEAESHSQYVKFNKLCAYLLQSINSKEEVVPFEVEEFEDPSQTAQNLMLSLRSLDFELDFPVSELKRAYGEAACKILEFLSCKSVAYQSLPEVKYLPHLSSEKVDEESKVEEAEMNKRETLTEKYKGWYEEVDRVSPLLEVDFESILNETNEGSLNSIIQNANAFVSEYEASKHLLARLKEESETKLKQINSNEAAVQTMFDKLIRDYTNVDKQVNSLEEERENILKDYQLSKADSQQLAVKLRKLNAAVEEKGNSITDTSQIVKLKSTLQQMKTEIRKQDFELGVLQHTLLQKNLCRA